MTFGLVTAPRGETIYRKARKGCLLQSPPQCYPSTT